MRRFDASSLFAELDRRRITRGLSWEQVAREIGVSAATIKRTRLGGRMEVDGMLAMVGWLGVTVERFVRDDRFGGRSPTSHEQLSGVPWDASYHNGPAPWDIGHPQSAIVRLGSEGRFVGTVLDAGCGTGENSLYVASLGLSVLGVDVAETALALARRKARDRGLDVDFAIADAFQLERLGKSFETVLDCGLFHTFDAEERTRYAASVAAVTTRGAVLYVLCFSDVGVDIGPHPISRADLHAAFSSEGGWQIASIEPSRVETRFHDHGAPAWLAVIKRV